MTSRRADALVSWAVARAEQGEPVAVELAVPARPILGPLVDAGILRRALVLLERDGSHPRVAVRPRRGRGVTTITELFEEDHRRLDELAAQMRNEVHEDPLRAIVLANLLVRGLRRHVKIEEEIVFPIHEARSRYAATTVAMHTEHLALLSYVARIEREADALRVAAGREAAIGRLLDAETGLAAVIAEHNEKEERGLFPLLDHTMKPADRDRVLRDVVLF